MAALSLIKYPVAAAPAPRLAKRKPAVRPDIILVNVLAIFTMFLVRTSRWGQHWWQGEENVSLRLT